MNGAPIKITFKEDLTGQKVLLFPMSPSENQELLETLKKEYSRTGLSEVEAILVLDAIQNEKERPLSTNPTLGQGG